MEATIINLEDTASITPQEVLAAFTCAYTPSQVQEKLWQLFYLAVKGGLEQPGSAISPADAALLIDQLTHLATAVSKLQQEGGPHE